MTTMTTALVLSRVFPLDDQMVHGIVQRLRIQVEALARVVDRIDCLFLMGAHRAREFSADQVGAHQERMRRNWTAKLSLSIAAVVQEGRGTRWQLYAPGILDFYSQQLVSGINNEAAVGAVRAALRTGPDLIFAHRLDAMSLLMRVSREVGRKPIFFDLDDIEHISMSRQLLRDPKWPMERVKLLQVPRLLLAEIQAIRRAQLTFVCSERDCRYLRRIACSRRIEVVVNSTHFPASVRADASERIVLFVGYMDYAPNAHAADILVRDIWPLVRARIPDARLIIAGRHPERLRSSPATDPSVTLTGFVDDLAELYGKTRVVCCPILQGGGTRIKIIEAAAHGRAVVATPLAAEGLTFRNGMEIILRKGVQGLAAECVRLLQDPPAAARLGLAARERALVNYEHDAVVTRVEQLYRAGSATAEFS